MVDATSKLKHIFQSPMRLRKRAHPPAVTPTPSPRRVGEGTRCLIQGIPDASFRASTPPVPGFGAYVDQHVSPMGFVAAPGFEPQLYWDLEHAPVAAGRLGDYRDFRHHFPGSGAYEHRDWGHEGTGNWGTVGWATTGISGTTSERKSALRQGKIPGNSVLLNSDQNSPTKGDAFFGSGEGA